MAIRTKSTYSHLTFTASWAKNTNYGDKGYMLVSHYDDGTYQYGYAWFAPLDLKSYSGQFVSFELIFYGGTKDTKLKVYIGGASSQDNASDITWNNQKNYISGNETQYELNCVADQPVSLSIPYSLLDSVTSSNTCFYIGLRPTQVEKRTEFTSVEMRLTYNDGAVSVTPGYPNNVNVVNSSDLIFTWNYNSSETQTQYKVEIKNYDTVIKTQTATSSNHYYDCPSSVLSSYTGTSYWRVTVYNSISSATSEWVEFTLMGETSAPAITNVTNFPAPLIQWTAQNQDCCQIEIYDTATQKCIYNSGILLDVDTDTFGYRWTYPGYLPHGDYYVKLRVLNTYGYYSAYATKVFLLNYRECSPATNISAAVNSNYAVEVSAKLPDGTSGHVFKDGMYFSDFNPAEKYFDYTSPLNVGCIYSVATTTANKMIVPDGETVMVRESGVLIHDLRDYTNWIHFDKTDDDAFDVQRADTYTKTFRQVIGRTYPIKEQMDYVVTTRSFTAFVNHDDYVRLMEICQNGIGVYYRANEEAFKADIDVSDRGYYISGGRLVTVSITRLDEG